MEFLAPLMAITILGMGLPFFALYFVALILLSIVTYTEDLFSFKSFVAVALVGSAIYFSTTGQFTWHDLLSWYTLLGIIAWFFLGSLWLLFKWNKVSEKSKELFDEAWATLVEKKKNKGETPPSEEDRRSLARLYIPHLKENKERAFTWILLWPLSVLSYILGDLVRDILEWILRNLGSICRKITRNHFGDLMDEPKPQTEQAA
jgi:hypothetical protein